MEILITGGAGFIGGHLAEQLLRDGHHVIVLDKMHPHYDLRIKRHTVDRCERVAESNGGQYEFVTGDIRDSDLLADLLCRVEYVFHQAARAGVRESIDDPRTYHEVNVDGTLDLLDAARKTTLERVVMASSSSVYGGREEYLPFSETDPTTPTSPYGASKLAAERYLCAYHEAYGLPAVALRYFTVYGPRMRPNMAITNFVSRCMNGRSPVIYGDGTQTRDMTFIDDIVEANLSLLSTDAADGEALNIGSSESLEIRTLARVIRDEIAPSLDLKFSDPIAAEAAHTQADTARARELIGYEPTYSIREGVSEFIRWYRDNRDWYEPLVLSS